MRIVFMGTPDFAVPSLRALLESGYEVESLMVDGEFLMENRVTKMDEERIYFECNKAMKRIDG